MFVTFPTEVGPTMVELLSILDFSPSNKYSLLQKGGKELKKS